MTNNQTSKLGGVRAGAGRPRNLQKTCQILHIAANHLVSESTARKWLAEGKGSLRYLMKAKTAKLLGEKWGTLKENEQQFIYETPTRQGRRKSGRGMDHKIMTHEPMTDDQVRALLKREYPKLFPQEIERMLQTCRSEKWFRELVKSKRLSGDLKATISNDLRGFQVVGKPDRPKGGRPKSLEQSPKRHEQADEVGNLVDKGLSDLDIADKL